MGVLGWIILGLIAGSLAKAILPGEYPGGLIVATIIGVVGAILGGFLGQVVFNKDTVQCSSRVPRCPAPRSSRPPWPRSHAAMPWK
jgi:uncharacterized membrane protein YeaQ/YmgE (transglycosylase-associated protein family)